ncbi:MAG TPA: DUF1990 domain-containing protein [Trebonia sp.]|nr:DUF1990 domain-containing protein [Trebonia sp.]
MAPARSRLRAAALTYPEVGSTARTLPAGYRHLRRTELVGSGPRVFAEAAAALMSWQVHVRAGIGVSASSSIAAEGIDVLLLARIGPLRLSAPCRVVYVIDEPRRRGFAYGTLIPRNRPDVAADTILAVADQVRAGTPGQAMYRHGPWV